MMTRAEAQKRIDEIDAELRDVYATDARRDALLAEREPLLTIAGYMGKRAVVSQIIAQYAVPVAPKTIC